MLNLAANFTAFALGMGTVFTALAVAAALSGDGLAQHFKQILAYINWISGVLVTAAGLYVTLLLGLRPVQTANTGRVQYNHDRRQVVRYLANLAE